MKTKKILNIASIVVIIAVVLVILANAASFFVVVQPGERGILLEVGKVKATYEPGLHFQIPIINRVVLMDVRTQKIEDSVNAASKDLQLIDGVIALNYHVDPGKVDQLYSEVGLLYEDRIISPAIQESVKAATALYTAEQLITERPKVKVDIVKQLEERLVKYAIVVEDVSIVNFDFSEEFNLAIEAKQTAEQNALKAENDLRRIEIEAKQVVESAKADAESIRIQGEALRENQGLVQLKMVEKWNGQMPYYYMMGGEGVQPLIQLPNMQ